MNVVKVVLLRESYVTQMEKMTSAARARVRASDSVAAAHIGADLVEPLLRLLDLLRASTVAVVEAIERWRVSHSAPFLWNGVNYLLRIPTDANFLDELPALTNWLGVTLDRNPFVLPAHVSRR